jgi:hypothetical protein
MSITGAHSSPIPGAFLRANVRPITWPKYRSVAGSDASAHTRANLTASGWGYFSSNNTANALPIRWANARTLSWTYASTFSWTHDGAYSISNVNPHANAGANSIANATATRIHTFPHVSTDSRSNERTHARTNAWTIVGPIARANAVANKWANWGSHLITVTRTNWGSHLITKFWPHNQSYCGANDWDDMCSNIYSQCWSHKPAIAGAFTDSYNGAF